MAKKNSPADTKTVDFEITASAIAKAVVEGDMVNLRLIFAPFSPARPNSTEHFDMPKYEYLLPDEHMLDKADYKSCLAAIRRVDVKAHILSELDARRPPQLPWDVVLQLADNAVRKGKYSIAAQAYELLRIRGHMQQEFLAQADAALDDGNIEKGVRGYLIATGLAYDYAAFPEPLPLTPDFQTRALLLHAEYPNTPQECIGMRDPEEIIRTALNYLLLDGEIAVRLESRPVPLRLDFLKEYIQQRDPLWSQFLERYEQASIALRQFADRLSRAQGQQTLADQIKDQQGDDPRAIPALLLGREIENGEWWQYLKELACEHPAAAFFVARQAIGDIEILVPRHATGSPVALALGIPEPVSQQGKPA